MKKIVALIIAVVMICSLSVTAFAATGDSPEGDSFWTVDIFNGVDSTKDTQKVESGDSVTVTTDSSKGKHTSWSVYLPDGKTAKENVDYQIVSGDLKSGTLVVKPLTNIVICGNYDNVVTKPSDGSAGGSVSDKTADVATMALVVMMLVAAACGFVAKKQLAK